MPTLPAPLDELAEETLLLAHVLGAAEDVQWTRGPTPRPRDDEGRRSPGGVPDPTGDTVADPRRLAVRAAYIQGRRALAASIATVQRTSAKLDELDLGAPSA
ncbi:hypothetical protein [Agromyces sp. H66]|uniref:DUF7169 domain-containing protein n=1 Tax=Agromyces sp. H66 TaxID=2529859 RepID=UPI0010AA8044|nr:hypothetical protein [Agromyces sp. H66]